MLFEPNLPLGVKMSMTSLFFHAFLYYDSIYTSVLIPFQLFLFIYKYNSLVYSQSVIAA